MDVRDRNANVAGHCVLLLLLKRPGIDSAVLRNLRERRTCLRSDGENLRPARGFSYDISGC